MQDKPDATELLSAVSKLLRSEVVPALDGRLALQVRIAANCIDIIMRELLHADADAKQELASLEKLLGETGSLEDMNHELCKRISAGEIGGDNDVLMEHLWRTTLRKVRIDQPRYPTFAAMSDLEKSSKGLE